MQSRYPPTLTVLLAKPRGFCAGVERAIAIVEEALVHYGAPVYVRHQIVHNHRVVEDLQAKGVIFVNEVDEIPEGSIAIFSAHGVSRAVEWKAGERRLQVVDATCPLVSKVHRNGARFSTQGHDVILIGHRNHPEVQGTLGRVPGRVQVVMNAEDIAQLEVANSERVAYITQTTLSLKETHHLIELLKERFPKIRGPHTQDICYATQNRQAAVEDLAPDIQRLIVVGAANSSNSNRLRELGEDLGVPSFLIADAGELDPSWLDGVERLGLTAGASAPDVLVQEVIDRLRSWRDCEVQEAQGIVETIRFTDSQTLRTSSL